MDHIVLHREEENKQKGMIVSIVAHILLLLLCLLPYMTKIDKPEQLSGITVAFGSPEAGSTNANPLTDQEPETDTAPASSAPDKPTEKSTSSNPAPETSKPKTTQSPPKEVTPVVDKSIVAAEEAAKEKTKKAAEAAEADKARKVAEQKAKEEADRKAEEARKKAAFDKSKGSFSDLLGSGSGTNGSTGNQGDPNGDPNSSALDQIATGSGRIGGGLSNRGVLFEPEINDNSQKTGKVVIKVCVDKTGKISEADYTQRGSTTTDKYLVDVATAAAKQYQFTPSDVETQCGSITIEFKVK